MTVLVTGGAGFIGSHVVDKLIGKNFKVIVIDNLSSGNLNNLNPEAEFCQFDLKDRDKLESVFKNNNIDYVIHLAAQVSVSYSMQNPVFDAEENIISSLNLLSLSKKYDVKKFIVSSTAAVYGEPKSLPIDESHSTEVISNYGLSKVTMEKYIELSGVNYLILRFSNVYGPRQDAKGEAGVVSIFIDNALSNNTIEIHGKGDQTRDFIYVEDVAESCLACLEKDVKNKTINISSNTSIDINVLSSTIEKIVGTELKTVHTESRAGDIKDSILCNNRAKDYLCWTPVVSLEEGLQKTIEFKKALLVK